jgi:hypothetical protein
MDKTFSYRFQCTTFSGFSGSQVQRIGFHMSNLQVLFLDLDLSLALGAANGDNMYCRASKHQPPEQPTASIPVHDENISTTNSELMHGVRCKKEEANTKNTKNFVLSQIMLHFSTKMETLFNAKPECSTKMETLCNL